jgi:hypothetical protein
VQIDDSTREAHYHLTADDTCLFFYEYTSGQTWAFSQTNSLIGNLKKKPSTSSENELYYKGRAIAQCAADFRGALNLDYLKKTATIVAVPCSKTTDHPDYDNRMERVAKLITPGLDIRNLVIQTQSTVPDHEAGAGGRTTVEQLIALYKIDESLAKPAPKEIIVLDDVLTAGKHFRAMSTVLAKRFPGVPIYGLFIARRVFSHAAADFEGVAIDEP